MNLAINALEAAISRVAFVLKYSFTPENVAAAERQQEDARAAILALHARRTVHARQARRRGVRCP